MTVDGYMELEGDCEGHDLKQINGSRRKCGKRCNLLPNCKGYLYIVAGEKPFPHPPCYLKSEMCKTPVNVQGLEITAYFKAVPPRGESLCNNIAILLFT